MTFPQTSEKTISTPTVSCSHCCGHGHDAGNAWMKPEIVFLCALGTFGISAVAWAVMTPHEQAVKPVAVVQQKPQVQQVLQPPSEMDRLFAQAGTAPVEVKKVAIKLPPATVAPQKVIESKPVETKRVEAEHVEVAVKKVEIAAKPAAEPENKSVDDVAEYNRALAAFFEKKKSEPAGDTADGAVQTEPPSYEEWLKSGKPNF